MHRISSASCLVWLVISRRSRSARLGSRFVVRRNRLAMRRRRLEKRRVVLVRKRVWLVRKLPV